MSLWRETWIVLSAHSFSPKTAKRHTSETQQYHHIMVFALRVGCSNPEGHFVGDGASPQMARNRRGRQSATCRVKTVWSTVRGER